jgi:DNA-binding HxlR family transcriptional regulator
MEHSPFVKPDTSLSGSFAFVVLVTFLWIAFAGKRFMGRFTVESAGRTLVVMKRVDSQCQTFQAALEVLSRPWCALILNALQGGPYRFTEIRERTRGPGDKILSARLKELETRGLLSRHVDAGPPVRVTYELTEAGRSFHDVACAIERWGRGLKPMRLAGKRRTRA